jgi:outer membrane usher protein
VLFNWSEKMMTISASRSKFRPRASALAAAVAAALACGTPPAAGRDDLLAQMSALTAVRQVAVLDSIVNGQHKGVAFALIDRGEVIGIDAAALRAWRVIVPNVEPLRFEDRSFIAIADLAGAHANLEQKFQRLILNIPPALLAREDIHFGTDTLPLSPAPLAGFLNYTLFGYSSSADSYGSGFFELGASGETGSLVATASVNTAGPGSQTTNRIVRFDTAFRRDDRDGLRTLQLGDSFTQGGAWGRSVRFGGIQYGTNFLLQPNLITYPLQAFSGTAVVPSTVDVFVNGTRIATQPVQPGPFTLNDVPLVTGAGDVQLVVRDAFGQQQVITQPFYASRRLLRGGLDEFQIALGALRQNYGLESFDYGSAMGSGYWRRGINDALTVEGRFEADDTVRALGAALDWSAGLTGIVTAGAAVSDSRTGRGHLLLGGYEYQGRGFNFSARSSWASPAFRLIGDAVSQLLQRQSYVSAGTNLGATGSIGLAWAAQRYRGLPARDTAALTYSVTLPHRTFFNVSLSRAYRGSGSTSVFASLSVPLDGRTMMAVDGSANRGGGQRNSYAGATVQRSYPTDEGFGYRLRATTREQVDGGLAYTWPYGLYTLEASSYQGTSAVRASGSGGIGAIAGTAFASRQITESFGVVKVGELEGVRVFHGGNPIGRTNEEGLIVLPRLSPYSANRITIDERDLPMDVTIRQRDLQVVPRYRAGTLANYEARRRIGAVLAVRLADGSPLPAGVTVLSDGSAQNFVSGHAGEIFVPDLPPSAHYTAQLAGGRCSFSAGYTAPPKEAIPTLGPFVCTEVK